jgi:sodium transport system permease protein
MKQILIIFKKDLLDTLRDKRTIVVMVLIPLLLFPMIFTVTSSIQSSSRKGERAKTLRVGLVTYGDDLGLGTTLRELSRMKVSLVADTNALRELIRADSLDVGAEIEKGFAEKVESMHTATITAYGPGTNDIANERLDSVLKIFQATLLANRLDSLDLQPENITPLKLAFEDTATKQENFGKVAGGFLPYIFILFCYMGCMFPAIDLFTGEKERSTIETLLSAPIERWKILVGKMMVIVTAGLSTAVLSLVGLTASLKLVTSEMGGLLDAFINIVSPLSIVALLLMLLPLVVFFAGLMIPATVYAKSFKEASSILQPLNFVVILPAVIGMMPGIALNGYTAAIPILNVVLSTKELTAGTMNWLLFVEVVASLLVFATIAVVVSFKRFGNEKNILRN